jgi:hypothetical protein
MKLSKKLLQTMTMSLAIGTTMTTTSCASLKKNAEVNPAGEKCNIRCIISCGHGKDVFTADNCPGCGLG